jgi:hypothetical protein
LRFAVLQLSEDRERPATGLLPSSPSAETSPACESPHGGAINNPRESNDSMMGDVMIISYGEMKRQVPRLDPTVAISNLEGAAEV